MNELTLTCLSKLSLHTIITGGEWHKDTTSGHYAKQSLNLEAIQSDKYVLD